MVRYSDGWVSYKEYMMLRHFDIEERCRMLGQFLIDHRSYSIRKIAMHKGMSKSQVHRDLHALRYIDNELYVQVRNILRSRGGR